MRAELPRLRTARQIQEELGVTRATAAAVMRQLRKDRFPSSRRAVDQLIEEPTVQ